MIPFDTILSILNRFDFTPHPRVKIKKMPTREKFETLSDIPVDSLYLPKKQDKEYDEKLGQPGKFPYTRGVQPDMYRGKFWTMRQYSGFGTAEESNKRYRNLIASGGTGLSVAFDLPTQMGLDSDDPRSRGEVGKTGVAIDSIDDMHLLLADIPLDKISISMTINATAAILLALTIAVAEEKGISADKLSGTIQNDLLKEYIARGTYIYPPEPSMRIITD
ncbi:MAG: methylmalonyl-CoA mutase family protein, partial [Deltaproteobacteria bacterium]|nr:methylmalonyl-CoA mutase family protein [Deltaproteobacteria bacterium]